MSDKPNLIQTVATMASMCDMDVSDNIKDEMFEFVASEIQSLQSDNTKLRELLKAAYYYLPHDSGLAVKIGNAIDDEAHKEADKCEHGKGLTDYCQPCGRINGGG